MIDYNKMDHLGFQKEESRWLILLKNLLRQMQPEFGIGLLMDSPGGTTQYDRFVINGTN